MPNPTGGRKKLKKCIKEHGMPTQIRFADLRKMEKRAKEHRMPTQIRFANLRIRAPPRSCLWFKPQTPCLACGVMPALVETHFGTGLVCLSVCAVGVDNAIRSIKMYILAVELMKSTTLACRVAMTKMPYEIIANLMRYYGGIH